MSDGTAVPAPLEESLDAAADGDPQAGKRFLQLFLGHPFTVPSRSQPVPMGGLASYPNDLVNILALDDRDRAIVPVFSSPEYVHEWCGRDLAVRTLSGRELLAILPEGWWLGVNVGRETSKELSPWELTLLRSGREEALDEIVHELFAINEDDLPDYEPLDERQAPDFAAALSTFAASTKTIQHVTCVREIHIQDGRRQVNRLLVGFSAPRASESERATLADELMRRAALYQIGGDRAHVVCEESFEGRLFAKPLAIGAPLYRRRPRSLLEVIRDSLGFSR